LFLAAWWRERSLKKPQVKKEPSIFWLWFKAKKEKVCPLVKFEQ